MSPIRAADPNGWEVNGNDYLTTEQYDYVAEVGYRARLVLLNSAARTIYNDAIRIAKQELDTERVDNPGAGGFDRS